MNEYFCMTIMFYLGGDCGSLPGDACDGYACGIPNMALCQNSICVCGPGIG